MATKQPTERVIRLLAQREAEVRRRQEEEERGRQEAEARRKKWGRGTPMKFHVRLDRTYEGAWRY